MTPRETTTLKVRVSINLAAALLKLAEADSVPLATYLQDTLAAHADRAQRERDAEGDDHTVVLRDA